MKNRTPNLKDLLRETAKLRRQLQRLTKNYPDEHLDPDERILNRILTNDWRYLRGGFHGPLEQRYVEAVDWVSQFDAYVDQLRDFCVHELEAPDRFATLPLPGRAPVPASECIRLLELQGKRIAGWSRIAGHVPSPASENKSVRDLRSRLQALVDSLGAKRVAADIGCTWDTLTDFLGGKTKPQEKTMQLFRDYLKRP
ncbi:MAG: hypothetical protein LAO55_11325 [Acidobacteriia bacterium]|nr:hypothetical protein [Terriglobia bacterium]